MSIKKILISLLVVVCVLFVVIAGFFSPIGYWRFEEGSGVTTVDSSGFGNTGTLTNGPTWITGKVGKAINFDGINDVVLLPTNPVPPQITIIAWVNPKNLGGTNTGNIFGIRGNGTNAANTFLALSPNNRFRFVSFFDLAGVTKVGSWLTPINSTSFNQWQQIAVTYDGSNPNNDPKFYINGQQVTTIDDGPAPTGVLRKATTNWRIGNNPSGISGFNGVIDELRVYDQVLAASDILSIYNSEVAPPVAPPVFGQFGGNPSLISFGQTSTISWTVYNATGCTASGGSAPGWSGNLPAAGSMTVTPTATASYGLTCTGPGGTAVQSSTITVTTPGAPVISIVVNPNPVTGGQASTLTWGANSVTGNPINCVASGGWSGPQSQVGQLSIAPGISTTYTLTCTDVINLLSASQSATLTVNPVVPPTMNFTANPTSIQSGQNTTLAWSSSGANVCTAYGAWNGTKGLSGSQVLFPTNTSTYTLTCTGVGGTANQSITINVGGSQKIANVTYCNSSPSYPYYNMMDVYYPAAGSTKPFPAVIYLHGGGWAFGDKSQVSVNEVTELNNAGYLVVSINYRLFGPPGGHMFPTFIEDAKCSVRHLRANAAFYEIDPNRIAIWGGSAGGHLASMVGTLDSGLYEGTGGYQNQSSRVQAVIDVSGPTDLRIYSEWITSSGYNSICSAFGFCPGSGNPILATASPVTHATADDPPFFIYHGDADTSVHINQSYHMKNSLTAVGVPVQHVIVPGGGHVIGRTAQSGQMFVAFLNGQFNTSGTDTTPPVRSNLQPSGALASGTTQTTISLTTNEAATCKYSSVDQSYSSMSSTFSTTGGTSHSSVVSGLVNGQSYTYYVRCQDGFGNQNTGSSIITFSVANPTSSLLIAYGFSEGTGSTTADSSGNGRTGTLTGTTWTTGKYGNALQFTPSLNSKVVATDFPLPQSITMEAWIYPTDVLGDRIPISKSPAEYEMRIIGGVKRFQAGIGTSKLRDINIDFNQSAYLNQWYHYTLTYNKTTGSLKLYRNGGLINWTTANPTVTDSTYPFTVGRGTGGFGTFAGKIDDVRIYNRELSQLEIQTDMNTGV